MNTFIVERLHEGEDLKKSIERIVSKHEIQAGCVLSLVGSLHTAVLRMAGAKQIKEWNGEHYEIVSATGTVSKQGNHIHISISDEEGNVFGGHLKDGCVVNTTVEVVIAVLPAFEFTRLVDASTGFEELVIKQS